MSLLQGFARLVSSKKGAKVVVVCWILAIIILSIVAPGSKENATSSGEGSMNGNSPSEVAKQIQNEQFPSKDGPVALLVFHNDSSITEEQSAKISEISKWLNSDNKPENVASALPFYKLPKKVQDKMFSGDQTTITLNTSMKKNLDSDQMYDTLQGIREHVEGSDIGNMQFEITGPAGIQADTVSMFKNSDLVLMFATVGVILVILILIYRSPLLAIIPLAVAGIVYMVVDRVLGLAGENGWFAVDSQALSIMMILLFAVLTDYSLFVLSRYRTELKKDVSKYEAMQKAFSPVVKPILFSGGTVLVAMLVLFFANFNVYHHFGPVFSVAMVFILLGGITLIPAIFALVGRKAFWPFVPKPEEKKATKPKSKRGFWTKVGEFVTKKPAITAGVLLILLILASLNVGSIKYSFNIMKSFPDDISSRQGFEILADHFPPGQLAPVSVILTSDKKVTADASFVEKVISLETSLQNQKGISKVIPEITSDNQPGSKGNLPDNVLSKQQKAVKLQLILKENPYDQSALNVLDDLRDQKESLLMNSGLDPGQYSLHYAGQTAQQLDVRSLNQRDTVVVFTLIAILIAIMLIFQSGSIIMGITMILTMLLSYAASLGLGWLVFHNILGFDAISYRLPVYAFVFLIALGVDYNIILVSRIREEAQKYDWKKSVSRGVALTGGVISSAGVILAGTFTVLMTQPLQVLFLFGFTMGIGILIDTFLVRGMLLPSILIFLKRE